MRSNERPEYENQVKMARPYKRMGGDIQREQEQKDKQFRVCTVVAIVVFVIALIFTILFLTGVLKVKKHHHSSDSDCENPIFNTRPIPPQTPDWVDCNLDGAPENIKAQCIWIDVPLEWNINEDNEDDKDLVCASITVFVKRIFNETPDQGDRLWMLPGGGGIPSSTNEGTAILIAGAAPLDIYLYDKRGTGNSSWIDCPPPGILEDLDACLEFAQENRARLLSNTFTNTALDIKYLIDIIGKERPEQRNSLMGSSQSTYLLQRYLILAPNQADAVILDSLTPSDTFRLVRNEPNQFYVALDLFGLCGQDPKCASHFEFQNPIRTFYTLRMDSEIGTNPCFEQLGITSQDLREKLSVLLNPPTWQLLPAIIARLTRCNDSDIEALQIFINQTSVSTDTPSDWSLLVEYNNNFAELWYSDSLPDESCDWLAGQGNGTLVATSTVPMGCEIRQNSVDIIGYPTDEYYGLYPTESTIPILFMHGTMDQAIPLSWARHAAKQLSDSNPNVTYIEIPNVGHAVSGTAVTTTGDYCGYTLAVSFILSPTFTPDTSCIDMIVPIDFEGTSAVSQSISLQYFGTENMWD